MQSGFEPARPPRSPSPPHWGSIQSVANRASFSSCFFWLASRRSRSLVMTSGVTYPRPRYFSALTTNPLSSLAAMLLGVVFLKCRVLFPKPCSWLGRRIDRRSSWEPGLKGSTCSPHPRQWIGCAIRASGRPPLPPSLGESRKGIGAGGGTRTHTDFSAGF